MLNRIYSGWYPLNGQLEHCANDMFKSIKVQDGTEDYLWTTQQAFRKWHHQLIKVKSFKQFMRVQKFFWAILKTGLDAPLYFFNPLIWSWQFKGSPSPVVLNRHTWEVKSK